jgi:para-nitrobenzyl esterase
MKYLYDAEKAGEDYAKSAGVTSIAALRKSDVTKLPAGMALGMAWPNIDGWVIPDDQYKLYLSGKFNDIPVLIGYNSDEGASFSQFKTSEEYISAARERYGKFAESLIQAYPAGSDIVPKSARDLLRDAAFGWHTWSWARLQTQMGNSRVFYYYFDQHPDYPSDSPRSGYGSPHGQDIPYVFQHLDPSNPLSTKTDPQISEAMATYWTNFAKFGDPNGPGLPVWPAFNNQNPQVMYFSQTPHTGRVPDEESLKVLDSYFTWRRTAEGEAWGKSEKNK